ncbi:MAG TPA: alpha/beta hydrolase [Streptosporangiaceae bacterium]|jgi:pimeloyl-ACP methyl ester carboxylesterase|nr:alpha/beta hydrolase [Streptosporangiaceae bacterium]
MEIDALERVQLGGITQWIRVRGADATNPVLLLMQQGPGLPIINDARRLESLLGLEKAFTVIYWDQRGTGLSSPSLRKNLNRFEISVTRMVDDTVTLLELLRDRFGGKTFVAGFSFGATFAAYAAVQRPELVAALVAASMDIDVPAAENNAYAFAVDGARQRGKRRAIRQLEAIGPPPHTTVKQFTTRARWVANFGGVATNANFSSMLRELVLSLVRSPDYSVADVIRTLRGMGASEAALLPQLATTDLVRTMPRLEVPLVMAQGRLDQVAPGEAAQRFHDSLIAPSKQLVWFESSAHTPHLEEPAKFRDLLMNVRASQLTST